MIAEENCKNNEDFNNWNTVKKEVDIRQVDIPYFHEQEIWWSFMGKNIGFEQNGKNTLFTRPLLIIKKFNNSLFWGIPLTTKEKDGIYYFSFESSIGKKQTAILSQLRLFDAKRLQKGKFLSKISKKDFVSLKRKIKKFF